MSVINVTKENFNSIKESGKTVLLDFYADWCMPCQMMSPTVHEIADENEEYIVGKINVDDEPQLAMDFGVVSIPMLVCIKNGKVASQTVGVQSKEKILQMLEG